MNKLLKSLLQTGLYFLEDIDEVKRKFEGEDHTLRYVLTFAAGVGVGLGVGILTAPASGKESRSTIAGKVRGVADRVKTHISGEGDLATGT